MASPLSWLLRLAALCYLIVPLAGQHQGADKCSVICNSMTMTQKIPERLLISYRRNQASCGKPAIILKTKKNRTFCANPDEEWVRNAMETLDRKAAAAVKNDGVFEKRIADGPTTTLAAGGTDRSVGSEPRATDESKIQETQTALGTSPELPAGLDGSWGTRSPSTSKAPDGGPSAGPERPELFNATAVTRSGWSSPAYQPGSDLWAKGEVSEAPSPQTLPTQAPSTQTPSTQTPSPQTLPTQAPSTQTPSTQTPSPQTLPTQAPSTQAPSTQTPSTPSPTLSHRAQDSPGSEGPSVQISIQDPTSEDPLGPTDVSTGPGSMPHVSMVLTSFGTPTTSISGAITARQDSDKDFQTTKRQAVGLLAFLGLLFGLGVAMFAYQSLQGCPRNVAGDMVEGLRHVPRSCGSNSYVLVPV